MDGPKNSDRKFSDPIWRNQNVSEKQYVFSKPVICAFPKNHVRKCSLIDKLGIVSLSRGLKYFIDKDMKTKITSWSSFDCIIIVLVELRGKIQFRYCFDHKKCPRAAWDLQAKFQLREEVLESVSFLKRSAHGSAAWKTYCLIVDMMVLRLDIYDRDFL